MNNKRSNWSKQSRKLIWKKYIQEQVWTIYNQNYIKKFELFQEAPCPKCGDRMLKAQYQGFQPDQDFSWDIDHIDSNPKNNYLSNLQPMHPWCNKQKN